MEVMLDRVRPSTFWEDLLVFLEYYHCQYNICIINETSKTGYVWVEIFFDMYT